MRLAALLVVLPGLGCAQLPNPRRVPATLGAALGGQPPALARMLAVAAQPSDAKAWAAQFHDTEPERRELAGALAHVSSVTVRARVESGGIAWPLVEEKSGWRVDDIGGNAIGLPTPLATLTALLHAFETHSLDGGMALLSTPLRAAVRRELDDRAKALRELLGQRRSLAGTNGRLRVSYGRYHVDLVNTEGTWLIEDLN